MKLIPLTQGKFAQVDDVEFEELSRCKWYFDGYYAARDCRNSGRKSKVYMHRQIMNTPAGMETDHIDGNGLNNCRSNLRICTRVENGRNARKTNNCSSVFKGVTWHKQRGKWQAQIEILGNRKHLGLYKIPEDAAHAYDKAALEYYGEFAKLNFPEVQS